jgi:GH24 family phage-related lysozyme (muramidase)
MHQAVVDRFVDFTRPLEGDVLWPYLDVLGLVTVGYGCLIDPVSSALPLPWKLPDGTLASADTVRAQWAGLKAQKGLAKMHFKFAAAATTIRLTEADAGDLLRQRMLTFEATLRTHFPTWDAFPADAQLCCMSMAWACGAGFPAIFKNFTNFANAHDWPNAAKCAAIRTDGNPGIVPRNAQNQLCLANATAAAAGGLPPEQLFWPGTTPDAQQADAELRALALQALALHPILDIGQAGRNVVEDELGPPPTTLPNTDAANIA